jgi:hypothetical protein
MNLLECPALVFNPVQYAVEIDRVECPVAKARQIFGPASLECQRFRLPQTRDGDPVLERIDPHDTSDRADEACRKLGQATGARTDIEHVITMFQRQRTYQEFAVVKLHDAGLLVGLCERGRIS